MSFSALRLVTWNVNSLKARLPRVSELLTEHRPDIALFQETKLAQDAFPHAELAELGYSAVHHGAGRWGGVAIAVRDGLELTGEVRGLPGEPAADEARWVEAAVTGLGGQPLRVASVYVPNGRAVGTPFYEAKLDFLDALAERVRARADGTALIVAGDFNVARTDLDLYDPAAFVGSTHVTAAERQRVDALVDAGMVDAFRRLERDAPGYTWWDYRAGHFHKQLGMRIDLALLSPDLAGRLVACGIDRGYRKGPKPSDHAPLFLELAGAAPEASASTA